MSDAPDAPAPIRRTRSVPTWMIVVGVLLTLVALKLLVGGGFDH